MRKVVWPTVILAVLLLLGITWYFQKGSTQNQENVSLSDQQHSKHVILFVLDSLMNQPLQKAIDQGKAPALKFLMSHGQYYPHIVSVFPTMSVAIESSLLTGSYPNDHKVPGLVWFDTKQQKIVNYGSGKKEVMKLGVKQVLANALYQLNNNHLSSNVKTIHEVLGEQGIPSASINALIYRGINKKELRPPKLAAYFQFLPDTIDTQGPSLLSFGSFSKINPNNQHDDLWQRAGFTDKFTADEVKYLIEQNKLPRLTVAYLSDNDRRVHKKGPGDMKGIQKADRQLQNILNSYDSWEQALQNNIWIVMGDSGQTPVIRSKHAVIHLNSLLKDYHISKLDEPINEKNQMVLGVNERMAYIYLLDNDLSLSSIANQLSKDKRIDIIAWKKNGRVMVMSSKNNEMLSFRPKGNYTDQYRQTWSLDGAPEVLDLTTEGQHIGYGKYPDAMARLYGALHSHSGTYLIANAKPGFEFAGKDSPTHIGGAAHGSLNKKDSLIPLIISGTNKKPEYLRMVDLKNWLLKLVSVEGNNPQTIPRPFGCQITNTSTCHH